MKRSIASLATFMGCCLSSMSMALIVELPADREIHTLNIDTNERVVLKVANDARIDGNIKAKFDVVIEPLDETAVGKTIWLNPNLVLSEQDEDELISLTIRNMGDTFFQPQLTLEGLTISAETDSHIEINNSMTVDTFNIIIDSSVNSSDPMQEGLFISGGVNLDAGWFLADLNNGSFYLSGGANLYSDSFVSIRADQRIIAEGSISAGGEMRFDGAQNGDLIFSHVSYFNPDPLADNELRILGRLVNIHQDIDTNASEVRINAQTINLFGKTISADSVDGEININPSFSLPNSVFNAFGGTLSADDVCITTTLNDFGLFVDSNTQCE